MPIVSTEVRLTALPSDAVWDSLVRRGLMVALGLFCWLLEVQDWLSWANPACAKAETVRISAEKPATRQNGIISPFPYRLYTSGVSSKTTVNTTTRTFTSQAVVCVRKPPSVSPRALVHEP